MMGYRLPLSNNNNSNNNNIMETTTDDIITNEEAVMFAVNAGGAGTETLGLRRRWKQGYIFCIGIWSDIRRATIMVDIIKVSIYALVLLISLIASYKQTYQYFYRDISHCIGVKDMLVIFPWLVLTLVWCLICIPIFSCGIYGAIEYNTVFVGVALMLHSVECVMHLMDLRIIAAIMAALCAYSHVFYIMEVSYYRGIPAVPKTNTQ